MEEQILAVNIGAEQTLEVNLPEQDNVAQIDVYWQDEVTLDLDASLMYIVSGKQEIQDYVDNKSKPEIDEYIETYAKPIVAEVVEQEATPIIDEYFDGTVKPSITEFAEKEMAGYAATATAQAEIATEKANEASETAKIVDEKIQEFGQVAEASKTEFVNFAQEKTEEFEQTAITATEQAVGSAERSRIWAEGEQAEVQELGGELSSKGWANIAKDRADVASASANRAEKIAQGFDGVVNTIEGSIGDIGLAPLGIDETQNKRRYLNGQVISQAQFKSFTNKIKSAIELYPNLATTETNWQAEVTNSVLGQCGKFVIDDTLGTIRLPKVVNINGLQDLSLLGGIKAESLPNISGYIQDQNQYAVPTTAGGVFVRESVASSSWIGTNNQSGNYTRYTFDASRSSSTYQDGAPVQQEAIQYPYFIQVATGVEESVDVTREIELNNPFFLGMSQYFESEPNNASWLISNGAFHSGAVYRSFYEWLLKIYNGTEAAEGVSVKASTDTYDDYDYVINTADETFRLPLLNGKETLIDYATGEEKSYNTPYTAEKNGWLRFGGDVKDKYVEINGGHVLRIYGSNSFYMVVGCPVTKGQEYIWRGGSVGDLTFFPYKGNGSLYFYVGETIQDANVINASGVLTRVAELSNEYIVGLGMPDYSAKVAISLTANKAWTAPCKCRVMGRSYGGGSPAVYGYINGSIPAGGTAPMTNGQTHWSFDLEKGDTYTPNTVVGSQEIYYIPFKGVN